MEMTMGTMVTIVLLVAVLVMILFSGCGSVGDREDGIKLPGSSSGSSKKSDSGISLEFGKMSPPDEMIKGQPVTFGFIFVNYQEHEVSDLKIKTKGYDTGYVIGLEEFYTVTNVPKSTVQGPGQFAGLSVSGVKVDSFEGTYNFNPTFDYCYSAKNIFREQICVPSLKNQCDISVDKSLKENGPLKVSIDSINSIENKVRIHFSIKNGGSGEVVNECFNTDDYADKYELKVSLGSQTGDCVAVSGQTIIGGESNFYCEFSRNSDDAYSSQAIVELDYMYQQSTQKKILVNDLNQGYN